MTARIPNDLASDIGTTVRVIVGGRTSGEIEYDGNRNWLKGSLAAGKTYLIDLQKGAGRKSDSRTAYIHGIHDSSGELIEGTTDNNSGGYPHAQVSSATTTGDY